MTTAAVAVAEGRAALGDPRFTPLTACWICGGGTFRKIHEGRFNFKEYGRQDPELAGYSDYSFWLQRCTACGFGQPEVLPTLPRYFDRMYDQHWAPEWVENEFKAGWKDFIFRVALKKLEQRLALKRRTLLDVGAHVGRLMWLAQQAGWKVEGIELNPRTSAYAARATGAPVHQQNTREFSAQGRCFDAVILIDVLEHIPDPVAMLQVLRSLVAEEGCVVVKVPCGPSQLLKERLRVWLGKAPRVSVADNLVHINHFTPHALRMALERAGFQRIGIAIAPPELDPASGRPLFPRFVFRLGCLLPGSVHTPLAMNLFAFAQPR